MTDLRVKYMGLELPGPVIAGSCGLTGTLENIEKLERAGAGAVILKSIFEEQIEEETLRVFKAGFGEGDPFPGAIDYVREYARSHTLQQHAELTREAKRRLSIPVIASVNCFSDGEWISFARELEKAGADALELNIFVFPTDEFAGSAAVEEEYVKIVKATRALVNVPLGVKIAPWFTHLPSFARKLRGAGASAITLFNRLVDPDIHVETLRVSANDSLFSRPGDARSILRWTGILAGKDGKGEVSASTGVHDGETVVKLLLAGATSVQVCSVLYERGTGVIEELNGYVAGWMERNGFASVDAFRGMLSYAAINNPALYERAQFIKYFSNH
ncbi:MAG: dihydroorotate dehydrogenase-like protein [Odoribacteraceae bacterium]|jgi:dihydroorotate dehydrogenase (fumarate)|nr:dihydroorotate dehydrogenase-like protein [Odoribacteraceae bacterium]